MPRSKARTWAYRLGGWTALLAVSVLLWLLIGPLAAIVFLALEVLLSVRRARFVDVGRFTVGVYRVGRIDRPLLLAFAFARYGDGPEAPKCGLEVIVGRVGFIACSIMPRGEWVEYKHRRHARGKGAGA
ncbi:hypothetical protein [Streptomyces sp. NPDC001635]